MDYAPHTESDIAAMLATIGRSSLDELFAHIPEGLRPYLGGLEVLRPAGA